MKEKLKKAKGITLVALVVTIIVLLILAGVAINLSIGDNGIFVRAKSAKVENEKATIKEIFTMKQAEYNIMITEIDTETTKSFLDFLVDEGDIVEETEEYYAVMSNKHLGVSADTGTGTGKNNRYIIEEKETISTFSTTIETVTEEEKDYVLVYYDKEGIKEILLELGRIKIREVHITHTETDPKYFDFNPTDGSIALKQKYDFYYDDGSYTNQAEEIDLDYILVPKLYEGKEVKKIGMNFIDPSEKLETSYGFNVGKKITIEIQEGVETIGDKNAGCLFLGAEKVIIPKSVRTMESPAFESSSVIMVFKGETPPENVSFWNRWPDTIIVPKGSKASYAAVFENTNIIEE